MFFLQIRENGDNFSYVVADEAVKEAAVVDSSFNVDEIVKVLKSEGFGLKYIINTHGHSDHTAGNLELRSLLGGEIVSYSLSNTRTDLTVEDGEVLSVGAVSIKVIYTPGHTTDSICLLVDDKKLLAGDTLFVGECGRTDLAGGSSAKMYESLFDKILKLNDAVEVYPGHDYGPKPSSTVGEERRTNYTLQPRSVEEFTEFMKEP
jgi:hydroxyacylglutathione hydrolase